MSRGSDHKARKAAYLKGHWAEWVAMVWLVLTGHRILERRFKTSAGEIDIIAKRADLVLMVEVKARPDERACVEAVGYSSQRRIHNAADIWLAQQRNGHQLSVRFDIIAIMPSRLPKHFKNMF